MQTQYVKRRLLQANLLLATPSPSFSVVQRRVLWWLIIRRCLIHSGASFPPKADLAAGRSKRSAVGLSGASQSAFKERPQLRIVLTFWAHPRNTTEDASKTQRLTYFRLGSLWRPFVSEKLGTSAQTGDPPFLLFNYFLRQELIRYGHYIAAAVRHFISPRGLSHWQSCYTYNHSVIIHCAEWSLEWKPSISSLFVFASSVYISARGSHLAFPLT